MKVEFTKEWVSSLPKTINSNGCWVSANSTNNDGYAMKMVDGITYVLHRLVISIYYNLDYDNQSWTSRHNKGCSRACIFHEHLQPGTQGDNNRDMKLHGTHANTNKKCCPKCGGEYTDRRYKTNSGIIKWHRVCDPCSRASKRKKRNG